jgi:secreted Zn-dependent insulinase-like peptidase
LKPDRDRYEYRAIQLANNLQVLLTSTAGAGDEKSAKVEAASIHVQAGHFDDTIPGLAHFHEHMLVSKQYEKRNKAHD